RQGAGQHASFKCSGCDKAMGSEFRIEKSFRCFVSNEFYGEHLAHAAHVAHMRMAADALQQQPLKIRTNLCCLLHESFAFHDVDIDEAKCGAHRMPRIREAMHNGTKRG